MDRRDFLKIVGVTAVSTAIAPPRAVATPWPDVTPATRAFTDLGGTARQAAAIVGRFTIEINGVKVGECENLLVERGRRYLLQDARLGPLQTELPCLLS